MTEPAARPADTSQPDLHPFTIPPEVAASQALDGPRRGDFGKPPNMGWVSVNSLVIDYSYQRRIDKHGWRHVGNIAREFSWRHFGVIETAPVAGERYAVVDGQHRIFAAMLCGIEKVPVRVTVMTRAQQAGAFAKINGAVRQVTLFNIFKAALAAGDLWAVTADRIARKAGCRLMPYPAPPEQRRAGQIFLLSEMRDIANRESWHEPAIIALCALRAGMAAIGNEASWQSWFLKAWLVCIRQQDDLNRVPNAWRGYARLFSQDILQPDALIAEARQQQDVNRARGHKPGALAAHCEARIDAILAEYLPHRAAMMEWVECTRLDMPQPPADLRRITPPEEMARAFAAQDTAESEGDGDAE